MLFSPFVHRFFFLLGLALSLCSLPFSPYALSVGLFTVTINWLLDGNWRTKWHRFQRNRALWVFLLVYLSILIGLPYSQNLRYALKELRLWLPILLIPVVIATSNPLSFREFKWLMLLFNGSLLVATAIVTWLIVTTDIRCISPGSISPFISHIRLSLMVVFTIFLNNYLIFRQTDDRKAIHFLLGLQTLWLLAFLFILQSLTGIAIFGIITIAVAFRFSLTQKQPLLRFGATALLLSFVLIGISFLTHSIERFYTRNYVDFKRLPHRTANGNSYYHDTLANQYENGYLVWINICYPELKSQWERVSSIPFDGRDRWGQEIKMTLIRYLASRGLTKDSVGVAKLDSTDIDLIENGIASVVFRGNRLGLYPRIYRFLWEIEAYRITKTIGGSSTIQRLVYLQASWHIIREHPLFGVGTGDGRDALMEFYRNSGINLEPRHWHMSHNQFLTVWIMSGLIGLFLFLTGLIAPIFIAHRHSWFLPSVFLTIILLSMLNEDTFETHVGISFASLFLSILIFSYAFESDAQ